MHLHRIVCSGLHHGTQRVGAALGTAPAVQRVELDQRRHKIEKINIIICQRTEISRLQGRYQSLAAVDHPADHSPVLNGQVKVGALHLYPVTPVVVVQIAAIFLRHRLRHRPQHKLVPSKGKARCQSRQFPGGGKEHRQHRHTVPSDLIHSVRQRHRHFRQRRAIDRLQLAVHQQPAAHFDLPAALQRIYIGKEHFVLYGKGAAVRIHSKGLHRGIYLLHLVILRMHRAVRTDNPVGAKIGIGPGNGRCVWQRIPVPRLFLFKIRAVKPQVRAVLGLAMQCLVHKVPDKAAAHIVILFKIRHIVGKVAQRILHRMGILAQQHRLTFIHLGSNGLAVRCQLIGDIVVEGNGNGLFFAQLFHHIGGRIHTGDHIAFGQVKIPLVVELARVVQCQCRLLHCRKGGTVPGLIAQTPHKHTWMIPVPQYHTLHTIHAGRRPHRAVPRHAFAAHAMALHLALVHYVKAVAIAVVIKPGIIRVMGGAHRVNVGLFHQVHILPIPFLRHSPAIVRIKIVAIHPAHKQGHAVKIDFFAPNFHFLKAHGVALSA